MSGVAQWLISRHPSMGSMGWTPALCTGGGGVTDVFLATDDEIHVNCWFGNPDDSLAGHAEYHFENIGAGRFARLPFDAPAGHPNVISPYVGPKPLTVALGDALWIEFNADELHGVFAVVIGGAAGVGAMHAGGGAQGQIRL